MRKMLTKNKTVCVLDIDAEEFRRIMIIEEGICEDIVLALLLCESTLCRYDALDIKSSRTFYACNPHRN